MEILFEDADLIFINKPSMVLSQPSFNKQRTPIKDLLEGERPDLKDRLFLHHRLDFETSGVFLMSKSQRANKPLSDMFQQHAFVKTYVCLTRPNPLQPGKKVACEVLSTSPESWSIKNYMAPAKDMANGKRRMISVKSGGWAAQTVFRILESSPWFHYIQAEPLTGRTHQIRQHLQESYRSILGDNIYGGKSQDVPRLMLHARSLVFEHPITAEQIKIEAPIPKDFESCLQKR
jgi:23S rRNA pseudouridine955/2504/2580 synthase